LTPSVLERIEKLWRELRFLDSNENYQAAKDFAHLGTYKLGMTALDQKRTANSIGAATRPPGRWRRSIGASPIKSSSSST